MIRRTNLPSSDGWAAFDVAAIPTATRGVVWITRKTPPKESNCLMFPSLINSGTERDRWTGKWVPPFCKVVIHWKLMIGLQTKFRGRTPIINNIRHRFT